MRWFLRLFFVMTVLAGCGVEATRYFQFQAFFSDPTVSLIEPIPEGPLRIIPQGITTESQVVIPESSFSSKTRAGRLVGWGMSSVVAAKADTKTLPIKALVVSEGWESGKTLLNPMIRDINFIGFDDTSAAHLINLGPYGNGSCGLDAWTNPQNFPDLYDGIRLNADGPVLEGFKFFFIPGTAVILKQSGHYAGYLHHIALWRGYQGIRFQSGSFYAEDIESTGMRGTAIEVDQAQVWMRNIHLWNSGSAVALLVKKGGTAYVEGIYPEQSILGVDLQGDANYLSGLYSWGNSSATVRATGKANQLEVFYIQTTKNGNGIIIGDGTGTSGDGTVISNGIVDLADNTVGIRVAADDVIIRNVEFGGYSTTVNRTGIRVEKVMNRSFIDVRCAFLDLCLDLNYGGTSRLGVGNTIRVVNASNAAMEVVNLPVSWDPSNRIYINGVLQNHSPNPGILPADPVVPTILPPKLYLPPRGLALSPVVENQVPSGAAIPSGTTRKSQVMLARYGDGTHFPAGQCIGMGPDVSILQATAETKLQALPSLVFTEDWGQAISEHQIPSCTWVDTQCIRDHVPAILSPLVRDITLRGVSGDVSDNPELNDMGKPDLYDGIRSHTTGGVLENVTIDGMAGVGVRVARAGSIAVGQSQPYDRTKPTLSFVEIKNSYKGLYIGGADHFIHDITIGSVRDYAAQFDGALAQVFGLHARGSGQVGVLVTGGPSVFEGDIRTSGQKVGMQIETNTVLVRDFISDHHRTSHLNLIGSLNVIAQLDLSVMEGAMGIDMSGARNLVDNGIIRLNGNGSTGIQIRGMGGWGTKIHRVKIVGGQSHNVSAMVIKSELINADIEITLENISQKIDFYPNNTNWIWNGNTIRVNGPNAENLVNLPPHWDSSNFIYLNDVLVPAR